MLIDEVKAALETYADGDEYLEILAERMARKLVADEAKLIAAEELAAIMEEYSRYTDWFPEKASAALAAYRKAGEAHAD